MARNILKTEAGQKFVESLKKPLEFSDSWNFLKKGKIRIVMIYEDQSFAEYFKKLDEDYVFTIKEKKYVIVPEAVIIGKYNTFVYYYNNPMPIKMSYTKTKLTCDKMYDNETFKSLPPELQTTLSETYLDSKALHVAFSSNLINKMYSESKMSTMNWLIIIGAVLIVILVILQATGTVDVVGMLSGSAKK